MFIDFIYSNTNFRLSHKELYPEIITSALPTDSCVDYSSVFKCRPMAIIFWHVISISKCLTLLQQFYWRRISASVLPKKTKAAQQFRIQVSLPSCHFSHLFFRLNRKNIYFSTWEINLTSFEIIKGKWHGGRWIVLFLKGGFSKIRGYLWSTGRFDQIYQ